MSIYTFCDHIFFVSSDNISQTKKAGNKKGRFFSFFFVSLLHLKCMFHIILIFRNNRKVLRHMCLFRNILFSSGHTKILCMSILQTNIFFPLYFFLVQEISTKKYTRPTFTYKNHIFPQWKLIPLIFSWISTEVKKNKRSRMENTRARRKKKVENEKKGKRAKIKAANKEKGVKFFFFAEAEKKEFCVKFSPFF